MKKAERMVPPLVDSAARDPAYSILAGIVDVVPASRWSFARVEPSGELTAPFGAPGSGTREEPLKLAEELRRHRIKTPIGPRIATTMKPLDDFSIGVTLVFADARAHYGILMILRDAELGPFTSSEISILTFALDAVSDYLCALRLQPPANGGDRHILDAPREPTADLTEGAFYVLDRDLQIVLAWSAEDQRRIELDGVQTQIAKRLPRVLEETVRGLTAAWSADAVNHIGTARPVSFLVVRTRPMSGPGGLFIGVRIDRFLPPNSLTSAASRFHISPREIQVLALLLDGNALEHIAKQLSITSSTVQDHIKSMLDKTESSNRSELIARVLGWESIPSARRA